MSHEKLKKLVVSGMFVAVVIVLSGFYIPVGASKCFPVQHMVNVLAAVILGPWWGVGIAFCTSLIRNMMGTGTLLAFPGSMAGAFCCGMMYRMTGKLIPTYCAEIIGTGILGGMLAFPVASFVMGREAAVFTYVIPFLISTCGGTLIAAAFVAVLTRTRALSYLRSVLQN